MIPFFVLVVPNGDDGAVMLLLLLSLLLLFLLALCSPKRRWSSFATKAPLLFSPSSPSSLSLSLSLY